MKIVNFRDVVTNFKIGSINKAKVSFYAKRLAKETSARRLASLLLVGLLVFQLITFVAPPQKSSAAGSDLVPGGFGSIGQLLGQYDANTGNIHGIMNAVGISREDLEGASNGVPWYCQGGLLSMGLGGAGTPSVAGTTVGDCNARWGQNPIYGIKINRKVFADVGFGARWYEIGVLYSCDNLVFLPTTPPEQPQQSVTCQQLMMTVAYGQPVTAGTPIGVFGQAQGQNISDPNYKVTMDYDFYVNDPDPAKRYPSPTQSTGPNVPHDDTGLFQDTGGFPDVNNGPLLHTFVVDVPGNYIFRLVVKDPAGNIVPGSDENGCHVPVTILPKPQQHTLQCAQLDIVTKTGQAPFTPGLKGTMRQVGDAGPNVYPSNFEYILLRKINGPPPVGAPVVNFQGTNYLEGNPTGGPTRIQHKNSNPAVYTDPASAPAFFANEFSQPSPGEFLIILRGTDQNGAVTAENPNNCYVPFSVTPQPGNFVCRGLQAQPASGVAPLKDVVLSAQASVTNATVKSYEFDFGDGNKQTVNTNALNASSGKHTYQNGGSYTAKVTIVTDKGSTDPNSCKTTITVTPPVFICSYLKASPTSGGVPLDVGFTASVNVQSAKVKAFQFDFGDGSSKTVDTNNTQITTRHTYNTPGKYSASVSIVTDQGVTPASDNCKVQITPSDIRYTKTVSNLTLLTVDGKPTDANNQVAKAGDNLRYQIAVCNASGATVKGFVFEDDITDILYYADVDDIGGASKVTNQGRTKLVWPPVDIAALPSGQGCVDASGNVITANFANAIKTFTVKIKDPIPTNPGAFADSDAFNCQIQDEFHGTVVITPIGVAPAKQIDCAVRKLPQTGAGLPIFVIAFLAASSAFLFFRNRLLKRELKLVETLSDDNGGSTNG